MGKRMTYRIVYLRLPHNNWATGWLTFITFYGRAVVRKTRGRGLSFFFLKQCCFRIKIKPEPEPEPESEPEPEPGAAGPGPDPDPDPDPYPAFYW